MIPLDIPNNVDHHGLIFANISPQMIFEILHGKRSPQNEYSYENERIGVISISFFMMNHQVMMIFLSMIHQNQKKITKERL